jgi:protein SCO1/2
MEAGRGASFVLFRGVTLWALAFGPAARGASPLADIGPAPPVLLTDQAGKPFDLARLQGKAVVVSFVYTTCGGSCPATTHTLYRVQQALKEAGLWGKRVELVSISLDPARDRPDVLAEYARVFDADTSAWHFVTGPPDSVAQVIAAWGMWVKPGPAGSLDHPSRIFLLDPRGHQREIYSLEYLRPPVVVHDVETVLAGPPMIADPEKPARQTGSGSIRR